MLIRILVSVILLCLLVLFRKRIRFDAATARLPRWTPYALSGLFFIIYLFVKFNRHAALHTFGFDLSAFDYAYYNTLHGDFLYTPFFGKCYLREHFFPAILLFLPFHALVPRVETLLVMQALMVALVAVPFYRLVRELTRQDVGALVFTTALLMNPSMVRGMEFDFHVEMLQPLLFTLAVLFAFRKRIAPYLICLLLLIMTKENEWLSVMALSIPLFFWLKERRLALFTLGIGAVCGAGMLYLLSRGYVTGFGSYRQRYAVYGDSFSGIAWSLIRHPGVLFSGNTFTQGLRLLLRTAFLPLLSPLSLAEAPDFFMHMLSASRQQKELFLYYGSGITTLLFISAAAAYAGLWRNPVLRKGLLFAWVPLLVLNAGYFRLPEAAPGCGAVIALAQSVPENKSAIAENEILPHLRRQEKVACADFVLDRFGDYEYILLNRSRNGVLDSALGSGGRFDLQGSAGEYLLYRRRP